MSVRLTRAWMSETLEWLRRIRDRNPDDPSSVYTTVEEKIELLEHIEATQAAIRAVCEDETCLGMGDPPPRHCVHCDCLVEDAKPDDECLVCRLRALLLEEAE